MSQETETIKERLDLADIVGEYVPLKRVGQHFKTRCPFHQEKTPSFVVSPDKGIWHCFGCFPPGQKIKTPVGYHDIETLGKGHPVISGTGEIRRVLASYERPYKGDLVEIRLRKLNYLVSLTADHTVFVVRGAPYTRLYKNFSKRFRKYLWQRAKGNEDKYIHGTKKYFPISEVPAGDIQKGDLLLYPIDRAVENIDVIDLKEYLDRVSNFGPRPPKIPLQLQLSDEFLRLVGYYIAEGSNHRAYIRFSLGSHEEAFAKEIVSLIKHIFGLRASIHRRSGSKTGIEVTACHSHLANIFVNLVGKGAANKHIPYAFQRLPFEKQKVLLKAIHKGDGTSSVINRSTKEHLSISTISRTLTEQLTDILLRGSFFPTVTIQNDRHTKDGVHHREAYKISWSEQADSRYNLIYYHQDKEYWLLPIHSIRRSLYEGPVYNLTVEKDHSYVATSFAVANCGKGGDVFSFVQEIEGIEFPEALKMLAERAGVELQPSRLRQGGSAPNTRTRLFDLLSLAAKFYHEILLHQAAGKKAQDYLTQRGVQTATLELFQLGYAPAGWDTLQSWLRKKGYAPAEMIAAGLVGESSQGKLYDRFRGRIMFPITDVQGRVVAFGGRIVPWQETGNEGKYVNSPEGMLYEKRRVVYNLAQAKTHLRHEAPAIVMEGYMDVVMSVQAGISNVVASSGTAFTAEQVALLKRYTKNLHFAFDGDAAGFKAQVAATEEALRAGMRVATIMLPAGSDPADIAKTDPAQLKQLVENPAPLVDVLLERLSASGEASEREEKLAFLLPLLAKAANPVYQGEMVSTIASRLNIPVGRVITLLEAARAEPAISEVAGNEGEEPLATLSGRQRSDRYLLGLIIQDAPARQAVWEELTPELFSEPASERLFASLTAAAAKCEDWLALDANGILKVISEDTLPLAEAVRVLAEEEIANMDIPPAQAAQALLTRLKHLGLMGRLKEAQAELAGAKPEKRPGMLQRFRDLAAQIKT